MAFRKNLSVALPIAVAVGATTVSLLGQSAFGPQGGEYRITGELLGDQVYADIAQANDGGYLVWQDSHTDGSGTGIKAGRLNGAGTTPFEAFRVNAIGLNNQENPRVARMANGAHLIVWQGGSLSQQSIYGRLIKPDGQFAAASELKLNSHTGTGKLAPAVAGLANGNGVVVWSSLGQDDVANQSVFRRGLQGVYFRRMTAEGVVLGAETLVNQTLIFSQRSPAVAALNNGNFVVTWVSERLSGYAESESVDAVSIFGRIFDGGTGQALSAEFQINTGVSICANPSVVGTGDGGFTVVWSEKELTDAEGSWDIAGRHFPTPANVSPRAQFKMNSHTYGDQFRPSIRGNGSQQAVVWSSLGQDGSREGVFGRFISLGQVAGAELQINSQTASRQIYPAVAAQSDNSFTVVWSSFVGDAASVDLFAQRFATTLPKPGTPVINSLSSYELLVAWPEMLGFDVAAYRLYVDGQAEPLVVQDIYKRVGSLNPGTAHSFRLAYELADGRISPLSDSVSGSTWGNDTNFDGLPDDWQRTYYGQVESNWDQPFADSDGDGVNNRTEFLAGTNPKDATSVLRMALGATPQGWQLTWGSIPGLVYRLQKSTDFSNWNNLGGYRFAPGATDSAFVDAADGMAYYRVIRIR